MAFVGEVCDICGSPNLKEIKCKVICQNCGTILKSCADLAVDRIHPHPWSDEHGS